MNRKITAFIIILGSNLLNSCAIYNFTEGKKSICEIHRVKLKTTWVKLRYGPPSWPPEPCPNSITKQAIALGCERPRIDLIIRLAKVHSCDSCNKQCERYY